MDKRFQDLIGRKADRFTFQDIYHDCLSEHINATVPPPFEPIFWKTRGETMAWEGSDFLAAGFPPLVYPIVPLFLGARGGPLKWACFWAFPGLSPLKRAKIPKIFASGGPNVSEIWSPDSEKKGGQWEGGGGTVTVLCPDSNHILHNHRTYETFLLNENDFCLKPQNYHKMMLESRWKDSNSRYQGQMNQYELCLEVKKIVRNC